MKTTYFGREVSARVGSLEGGPPEGGNPRVLLNPSRTHRYRNLHPSSGVSRSTKTSIELQENPQVHEPPSM
jgi:hypothetical protein